MFTLQHPICQPLIIRCYIGSSEWCCKDKRKWFISAVALSAEQTNWKILLKYLQNIFVKYWSVETFPDTFSALFALDNIYSNQEILRIEGAENNKVSNQQTKVFFNSNLLIFRNNHCKSIKKWLNFHEICGNVKSFAGVELWLKWQIVFLGQHLNERRVLVEIPLKAIKNSHLTSTTESSL